MNEEPRPEEQPTPQADLEPPIQGRELPADVAHLRELADAEALQLGALLQPRIDAHLAVYQNAVDVLMETHRAFADETDLEIGGESRWAAIWEMSGRSLGISNVLLHDLRGGFASEANGSLRALHEATQLLGALSYHEEEDAVRRWLAGEWIRPGAVRRTQGASKRSRSSGWRKRVLSQ